VIQVFADFRLLHGEAHLGSGLGDRVAAKIDVSDHLTIPLGRRVALRHQVLEYSPHGLRMNRRIG